MKFKIFILLPLLFGCISMNAQKFSFSELESMIGENFKGAESYLLQNPNWEAAGEAETAKGIRLKYKNKKREEQTEIFNLVDLYKSEKKNVIIAISIQFKSKEIYQQYLNDLNSSGYEMFNSNKKKNKYGRMYKKGKTTVITEVETKEDSDGKETKIYFINILTKKKYK